MKISMAAAVVYMLGIVSVFNNYILATCVTLVIDSCIYGALEEKF